jgi:hypothetical protein
MEGRRLTGPRACGALPEKSKLAMPSLIVDGDGELDRLVDLDAVAVEIASADDVASGSLAMARAQLVGGAFRIAANARSACGAEALAQLLDARAPICVTAIWAWMSPRIEPAAGCWSG